MALLVHNQKWPENCCTTFLKLFLSWDVFYIFYVHFDWQKLCGERSVPFQPVFPAKGQYFQSLTALTGKSCTVSPLWASDRAIGTNVFKYCFNNRIIRYHRKCSIPTDLLLQMVKLCSWFRGWEEKRMWYESVLE